MKVYCVKYCTKREMKDTRAITMKNGIITNEPKNINRGKTIAGVAMGTKILR